MPVKPTAIKRTGVPPTLEHFDRLPNEGGVRVKTVAGLLDCSEMTVWRRVKSGLLPKPDKRGGTTTWNVGKLRAALRSV